MPPPAHRKKPFSTKQKKKQLQEKRERKQDHEAGQGERTGRCGKGSGHSTPRDRSQSANQEDLETKRMNQQPGGKTGKGYDPNRYRLHFLRETNEDVESRKALARVPLDLVSEEGLELDIDELYKPGTELDMPKRPPWNYKNTREQLNAREEKYFREYLEKLFEQYGDSSLSYFELNLETWRQLWRVVEMADVILLITDIRHPALHFAPTLYDFLTKELKKPMIMVLNKIDLAPPPLVVAWKKFFEERFPDVHIVLFTSFPKNKEEIERMKEPGKVVHKRRKTRQYTAVGPMELLQACEDIVKGEVDLSSWREKIEDSMSGAESTAPSEVHLDDQDTSFAQHERFKDGILHIGCCGYPNVGKSSLMNGLMGRKVVSVSKTPGHTKHFQTIFLTPAVKLIDSPGIVFPSLVAKPLQILAGIYPIAQVREPYTTVGYLSQRIPLPNLLKLKHPEAQEGEDLKWSAYDICEAWADKRKFLTAKAARLDVYRAANSLLRLAVEARLILCLPPKGYTANKADWENHAETKRIGELQELCRGGSDEEQEEPDVDLMRGDASSQSDDDDDDDDKEENEADTDADDESDDDDDAVATKNPFALLGNE